MSGQELKPRVERAEKVFGKIKLVNVWTRSETASGASRKCFVRQKLINVYVSTRCETASGASKNYLVR